MQVARHTMMVILCEAFASHLWRLCSHNPVSLPKPICDWPRLTTFFAPCALTSQHGWKTCAMCIAQITEVCLHIGKPAVRQHRYTHQHCRALTPDRNGKGQSLMRHWCKQSCSRSAARAVHSRLIPPVAYQTSSGSQ